MIVNNKIMSTVETFLLDTDKTFICYFVEEYENLNYSDFSPNSTHKELAPKCLESRNGDFDDFKVFFDGLSLKIFAVIISFLALTFNTFQQIILIKAIHIIEKS